jgi:glycosyltransferase involved in cell wall biosynthesis
MIKILKLDWNKIICVSEYIERSLKERIPKLKNLCVIMHGIDTEKYIPLSENEKNRLKKEYGFEGKRVILHPARFLPWKGILPAVKCMPDIIKTYKNAVMVLTGKSEMISKKQDEIKAYTNKIESYIKDNALQDSIIIGKYAHKDMPKLTALSDILIYTTIGNEPFGLCPVEGMACGVPVIVTNSGGLTESVMDGVTGFVIDKEKLTEELGEKIILLLSNSDLSKKIGITGRKRVESFFTKERMTKDFINILYS